MLGRAHLRVVEHQHWLDELNVFPIADADSGRNMAATLAAVCEAAETAEPSVGGPPELDEVVVLAERAAIRAARGNSGVILAEWLRGALSSLPASFDRALAGAAAAARSAMDDPVEGTMITVAADAAQEAHGSSDLEMLVSARRAAEASVARTPSLLPVLARHGVVDAGGAGLLCVLDGFVLALGGDAPERRGPASPGSAGVSTHVGDQVEVMLTIEATAVQVDRIEREWRALGDSIAVAGLDDLWRLHVHTDRPDAVIAVAEGWATVVDRVVEPLVEGTR